MVKKATRNCIILKLKALQRVVRTAQWISGCERPSIQDQDIYNRQCVRKTYRVIRDPDHLNNILFELLLSGKRYGHLKTWTSML